MMRFAPLAILALTCSAALATTTQRLTGQLSCVDCDATADFDFGQASDFQSSDGNVTIEMQCSWGDEHTLCDFYMHMELEADGIKDWRTIADTNGDTGSTILDVTVMNGKWFKKNYVANIYAYTRDISVSCNCQDDDSDDLSFTVYNSSFVFKTETDVVSPYCGIYKWHDVTVSGTAYAEPPEAGVGWQTVKTGTNIQIDYTNGSYSGTTTVPTGSLSDAGRFSAKFDCPVTGWDENSSWCVTATLTSGQPTKHGYSTTYGTSTDTDYVNVYTTLDALKQALASLVASADCDGHLFASSFDLAIDTDLQGYDGSGAPTVGGSINTQPGATTGIDLGYYTGATGSVTVSDASAIAACSSDLSLATTSAGGFWDNLYGLSLSWGLRDTELWDADVTFIYDPVAEPAEVLVTVYDDAGVSLGSDTFMVNPNARLDIHLPDDIPGLPANGEGTIVAEETGGKQLLCGGALVENTTTGGASYCAMSGAVWEKMSVPLVDESMDRTTTFCVQNPTDTAAEVSLTFYDESGAVEATETSIPLSAHASEMVEASIYVGSDWRGSVEVDLESGEGVCGSVTYEENGGDDTASMPLCGQPSARVCLPIVGDSIDWEALYSVHNPTDEALSGSAYFLNADGTTGTELAVDLDPHETVVLESDTYEGDWDEAWATFDFRVTSGDGGVVGGAVLHDPITSKTVAAACAPLPESAHTPSEAPWAAGWNMVSIPHDPLCGEVDSVLALPAEVSVLDNALFSYSPVDGYAIYPGDFTTMGRGVGYWLYLDTESDCEYLCATGPGDFDINLREGWNLWGYPFGVAQDWDDCSITDGTDTYDPVDAEAQGWIQRVIYGYDDGYYQVPTEETQVEPWRAYWLLVEQSGLRLLIPHP